MILRPEGVQTVSSGSTAVAAAGVGKLRVTGSTFSTLTVTFPPTPADRDNFLMQFSVAATILSLVSGGSATILGGATAGVLNGVQCYEYDAISDKWFRLY